MRPYGHDGHALPEKCPSIWKVDHQPDNMISSMTFDDMEMNEERGVFNMLDLSFERDRPLPYDLEYVIPPFLLPSTSIIAFQK